MKLILRTVCIKSLIVSTRDACTRENNVKLPALLAQSISTVVYFIYIYIYIYMLSCFGTVHGALRLHWLLYYSQSAGNTLYGTSMKWPVPSSRGGPEENEEVSNTRSASPFCTPSRRSHSSCRMCSAALRVKRR